MLGQVPTTQSCIFAKPIELQTICLYFRLRIGFIHPTKVFRFPDIKSDNYFLGGSKEDLGNLSMLDQIERLLKPHCEVVERLSSGTTRDVWREWNQAFPLEKKQPHAIVEDTILDRLVYHPHTLSVDRHALNAYRTRESSELYILTLGSLAGWRCECDTPPPVDVKYLEDLTAELIVTPTDFTWTFGRRCVGTAASFVFVQPEFLIP